METLERFENSGLVLNLSPTRLPPGAAMAARNAWFGHNGSINSRPGYRRLLEVSLAAPISMITQFDGRWLIVAGTDVDEEGEYSCA